MLPTQEAFDARQITLWPNPAGGRLEVVSAANVPIREIRLLSLGGQELSRRPVGGTSCELQVAVLPAGVYSLLLLMNDGSQCHKRFVKS